VVRRRRSGARTGMSDASRHFDGAENRVQRRDVGQQEKEAAQLLP
jgi:hypothetical protein